MSERNTTQIEDQEAVRMENELSLEESFEKIELIVEELENTQITLEDSFKLYEQGMQMLKRCNDMIDTVEKKVQVIQENGELDEF